MVRLECTIGGSKEPLDLVDLEDPREAAREAGRRDRAPRVARGELLAGRKPMEGADGGEPLRG